MHRNHFRTGLARIVSLQPPPAAEDPSHPPATIERSTRPGITAPVTVHILPYVHPHMATERQGPTPTEWLQPPGFLGMNYGRRTVYVALVAHAVYEAILGGFYGLGG